MAEENEEGTAADDGQNSENHGGACANPSGIQISVLSSEEATKEFFKADDADKSSDINPQEAQNLIDDLEESMESLNVSKEENNVEIKEEPIEPEKEKSPSLNEVYLESPNVTAENVEEGKADPLAAEEDIETQTDESFELKLSGSDNEDADTAITSTTKHI